MTDGKCSCNAIQAAILTDEALSEEQKKHIEACNECKALLSQAEAMKRDLGALSVPGISEGSIADGVMQRIKEEKTSAPVHKFKITHHLGTAAAIVIILAAALMIRNPSETDFDDVPENENHPVTIASTENNHKLSSPEAVRDYADEEEAIQPTLQKDTEVQEMSAESIANDEGAAEEVRNNSARVMMKSARPPETAYAPDTQAELESDAAEQIMLTSEESVEEEAASPEISPALGAGGSGGGSSASESNTLLMAGIYDEASNSSFIFEGIDFGTSDEDFESNINLANERMYELFGEGFVISKSKLEGLGIDNKTFIKYAKSITREMIEAYGSVIDIFE